MMFVSLTSRNFLRRFRDIFKVFQVDLGKHQVSPKYRKFALRTRNIKCVEASNILALEFLIYNESPSNHKRSNRITYFTPPLLIIYKKNRVTHLRAP